MKEPDQRMMAIVEAALKLPPKDRAAYLDQACGGDAALRQRIVEALFQAQEAAAATAQAGPAPLPEKTEVVPFVAPFPTEALGEKPGDRIGSYKLLEQIGEGGMGTVWVAEQTQPIRREVALKVIKLGMDTKMVVARFEAERQALALMDHPNIAKVLDAGATETGRPFFVMELVKGVRITDYCDQHNLSTAERLGLFMQVCRAIQHAHQKGIIHRDLKPSNILVALQDGVPVPKVIDFGIAKATAGQRLTELTLHTALAEFIGTPAYMSPEQAELTGVDIDTRSDIYSLGVLLYELLTSKTPFDAQRLVAAGLDGIRRIIREEEPPRPSTRLGTLDSKEQTTVAKRHQSEPPKLIHLIRGDLDWIVMKCLEKDRTRRYETANGLAMDLQRHLHDEPVVARPPGNLYRFQKLVRRNKLAFAAAGAVALALVAGLGVSTWSFLRERKAHANERRLFYVADLNLAQQAWDQNNIGLLKQLLEETQVFPDRGFEWYYWQRQTHLSLQTLRGNRHGGGWVSSVAFSPDGQRIVTLDGDVRLWDAASGRELLTIEGSSAHSVAFSPDGQRIVTGDSDGTAKVWDATNGRKLLTLKGDTGYIDSAVFSPDGQRIVTVGFKATVWDAASGAELVTLQWQSGQIHSVAFSPDGLRIATGGQVQTVKVWDVAGGRELLTIKCGQISSVAFSPDGQRIITGSFLDKTAKVWDANSGRELLTLDEGHTEAVLSVAFSPDGQRIVTGSSDRTAKVWDAASGRELLTLKGHNGEIISVAFSPDGRRIVTGGRDGTAKVWDAGSSMVNWSASNQILWFRRGKVWKMGWVRTAKDPDAVWWDAGSHWELLTFRENVNAVAFSPDGQRIVTGGRDGTTKVWDVASGRELLTLKGTNDAVFCVAFSPDGRRIVTGSRDNTTAKVWDATSGGEILTHHEAHQGSEKEISSVAFSPDGQRIVTGSMYGAKVWEAASGRELRTIYGHVTSLAFSPDGQRIVTGNEDQTTKVWDAASGRELLKIEGFVTSVAFSPDGRRIVTGGVHQAKVWEAASGRELLTLKGHNDEISCVAFSPDGRRIVTGSWDKTAKVWEAASGRELLTLKGQQGRIHSVAFSPDGQRIVTVTQFGTGDVFVWEAARPEQVAKWQAEEAASAQRDMTSIGFPTQ